ncbi:tryptophan--tRNA ligase, partial [Georgenia sp. 10Sc9-8]|nr:tryptophan--tRNA ligase [Georgenia halotolerans]
IAAMCTGRRPQDVAAEIGDGGAGTLKKVVTEAVNEMLAPVRARRAELVADPGYLERVLAEGNERATAIAESTLTDVRRAMRMDY